VGAATYPHARRLLITADAGGSNSHRARAWKAGLAALSARTGLEITVCHFPPGTSKWNKIEVRHEASPCRAEVRDPRFCAVAAA
jgi:Rhodopirellula transposase DDE domain